MPEGNAPTSVPSPLQYGGSPLVGRVATEEGSVGTGMP